MLSLYYLVSVYYVFICQIKEEFGRITTIQLEETFMLKLDAYTPRLLQLMRAKGGAAGSRMRPLLDTVDEVFLVSLFTTYTIRRLHTL